MTQNTQFYLTKQNLLRTLFLQPTRQQVYKFMYCVVADSNIFFFVLVFNSDIGKEFIVTVVVDPLKGMNPNCFIVTGCPRTPRDQGFVESTNKVVQQVLKCISSDNRVRSTPVNWTKLLGHVMAVCMLEGECPSVSLPTIKV